jgi:hypothetical protein
MKVIQMHWMTVSEKFFKCSVRKGKRFRDSQQFSVKLPCNKVNKTKNLGGVFSADVLAVKKM